GDRVFVPTYSGRVDEVELNSGALLGYYELGQPLSAGGAVQPGTHLLYLPADSFCVYVLDVAKRTCAAVLYTGHPGGSLRGPPALLSAPGGAKGRGPGGYLLLGQADGLDAMKLRAFAVPPAEPDAAALQPELRLDGWAWFAPAADGEHLALATDAGEFVLCEIRGRADGAAP